MRAAPTPELLARTLAKLLIAVSSRNSFQLSHARDEARRTLPDYRQAEILHEQLGKGDP